MNEKSITISTEVEAPIDKVWQFWTSQKHIAKWNSASDEWHTVKVENEPKTGGKFLYRMEAKDGSVGFDFSGTYTDVKDNELLAYSLDDGRNVRVEFKTENEKVKITEKFEPEQQNSIDMQKSGWHAILESFKKYAESTI